MAELAGLDISELVNKSISYLGTDIANRNKVLQDLKTTIVPRLQFVIQEAQHRPSQHEAQFASLLAHLKDAYFDAEAILHDLESNRLKRKAKGENKKFLVRLSSKPIIKPLVNFLKNNSPLLSAKKRKLLHRLKKLKEVAAEILELQAISDTTTTDDIILANYLSTSLTTTKVFGRDGDRENIIKFLLDEQGGSSSRKGYSVVAVTGMVGAGKTTLAQYVYNDPRVKQHFRARMWLCLSLKLDIIECTKGLIECVTVEKCPSINKLDYLQDMLLEILPTYGNVMLVLDDVRYDKEEEHQLDNLLKPFALAGATCKIVVTSRSALLPSILSPDKLIHLSDMAPDDFRSFLRYQSIDNLQIYNPQLKNQLSDIADRIAKQLSKSPLVAKIVCDQLRDEPDITFWQATLENVNLSNTTETILMSFHHFDVKLQQCFLFCSVFPKGTRYNLDSLVPYWWHLILSGPQMTIETLKI